MLNTVPGLDTGLNIDKSGYYHEARARGANMNGQFPALKKPMDRHPTPTTNKRA